MLSVDPDDVTEGKASQLRTLGAASMDPLGSFFNLLRPLSLDFSRRSPGSSLLYEHVDSLHVESPSVRSDREDPVKQVNTRQSEVKAETRLEDPVLPVSVEESVEDRSLLLSAIVLSPVGSDNRRLRVKLRCIMDLSLRLV